MDGSISLFCLLPLVVVCSYILIELVSWSSLLWSNSTREDEGFIRAGGKLDSRGVIVDVAKNHYLNYYLGYHLLH